MTLFFTILAALFNFAGTGLPGPAGKGTLKITFVNKVKDKKLELDTATYKNPYGETYTVKKFRYYISHVAVTNKAALAAEKDSYHLADERRPESLSFSFSVKDGNYAALEFLLGVDSLKNVSGAQSGALDPLNDMFWTWNTGYVMAKLEASSPQSMIFNHKVEYHIGGFKGADKVLKQIKLGFGKQQLIIKKGRQSEVFIDADLDKWWGPGKLRIAETPACNTPGKLALRIADNYAAMFTLSKIINPW